MKTCVNVIVAQVAYHTDECPVQFSISKVDDTKKALRHLHTIPFLIFALYGCEFGIVDAIWPKST